MPWWAVCRVQELPDEQVQCFNEWFASLPSENIKACYHTPNLQNVLDTHTNKLYEQAAGYYQGKNRKDYFRRRCKRNHQDHLYLS